MTAACDGSCTGLVHLMSSRHNIRNAAHPMADDFVSVGRRCSVVHSHAEITTNSINNSSVVLRIFDMRKSVLFTGDFRYPSLN